MTIAYSPENLSIPNARLRTTFRTPLSSSYCA